MPTTRQHLECLMRGNKDDWECHHQPARENGLLYSTFVSAKLLPLTHSADHEPIIHPMPPMERPLHQIPLCCHQRRSTSSGMCGYSFRQRAIVWSGVSNGSGWPGGSCATASAGTQLTFGCQKSSCIGFPLASCASRIPFAPTGTIGTWRALGSSPGGGPSPGGADCLGPAPRPGGAAVP